MTDEIQLMANPACEVAPSLRDLLAVVFRQRRLVIGTFATIFLSVFLYGVIAPQYQSEMKILVRRGRVDPVVAPTPSQAELVHTGVAEEDLNSEVELLRDDEILGAIVNSAGPKKFSWLHPWDDEQESTARAIRRLKKRLTVEPLRKTSLIDVTYECSDRQVPARVLHALAGAYLERHAQVHRPSGESGFFDQQIAQSRQALEQAESQLVDFTRTSGVVAATFERDAALRQWSEAEEDQRQSTVSIATTAELIAKLQAKLGRLPERSVTLMKESDNPELMEKLKSRLLELELARTELLVKYDPAHRTVRQFDDEIAQAKAAIASAEQEPVREKASDNDVNHEWATSELLKHQVDLSGMQAHAAEEGRLLEHYRTSASELTEKAIQQERLMDNMKDAEQTYLLYVNKREEARIGDALDRGGILNVAIAEDPTEPALPQLSILGFAAIGVLAGGVVGIGAAFGNDYLNPAFRTPDEVLAYLRSPVLASLPRNPERRLSGRL
jgi:uncharacterized protein involved in exopolysaccharide biosynthesis